MKKVKINSKLYLNEIDTIDSLEIKINEDNLYQIYLGLELLNEKLEDEVLFNFTDFNLKLSLSDDSYNYEIDFDKEKAIFEAKISQNHVEYIHMFLLEIFRKNGEPNVNHVDIEFRNIKEFATTLVVKYDNFNQYLKA